MVNFTMIYTFFVSIRLNNGVATPKLYVLDGLNFNESSVLPICSNILSAVSGKNGLIKLAETLINSLFGEGAYVSSDSKVGKTDNKSFSN